LAGAWASGAPLAALAALAAAVAFGLRARDQRVAAGPTTSAGRRGRVAPSRTRTAPAARRRTGSTAGTSARKPKVRAAAGPAKHGGSVGRSVRRQLRRLATGGAAPPGTCGEPGPAGSATTSSAPKPNSLANTCRSKRPGKR